jgi:DNA-binding SARP family transcriptional activator
MEFRILGPLEVEEEGQPLAPRGRKARALLAVLLLHANRPVAADRLVDEVWGDELPENASKSLQIQVSRLRKALGDGRLHTTSGGGYQLSVGRGELDSERAAELVEEGSSLLADGRTAQASEAFSRALDLFRGDPLEEFAADAFARAEARRLDELRLAAAEGRADAELARGHGPRLVGELEALVAENPFRERLREQLMTALYGAGRQADALAVYADARARLGDELGLEPGAGLGELQRRILNHDLPLAPAGVRPRLHAAVRRRPLFALAAAAIGVAAVLVGIAARAPAKEVRLSPRSLGLVDPSTLAVRAVVPLDGVPSELSVGKRAVFVGLAGRRNVISVDPTTRATAAIGVPVRPGRLAAGEDGLWLLDPARRLLALLGSEKVFEVGEPSPDTSLDAVATAGRRIWLAQRNDEFVFVLDTRNGRWRSVPNGGPDSFFEGPGRRAAAVGSGSFWVSNPVTRYPATERLGRVSRLDLETGEVLGRIRLPAPPVAIATSADAVWVALERGEHVWRIDPRDDVATAAVPIDGEVVDLAVGENAVWALSRRGTVSRIDPRTSRVTGTVELGRGTSIVAGHGSVWVAAR